VIQFRAICAECRYESDDPTRRRCPKCKERRFVLLAGSWAEEFKSRFARRVETMRAADERRMIEGRGRRSIRRKAERLFADLEAIAEEYPSLVRYEVAEDGRAVLSLQQARGNRRSLG